MVGDRGRKAAVARCCWRSEIRRIGEIVVIGRVSLARSIDLARMDREGSIGHTGPIPSVPLSAFFSGTIARSSNFTIRFPPGDELLKRDARRSFPVSYCIPILRERSKLDRVAQDAIEGGGGGRKKDRCGEQLHCGPSSLLGPTFPGFLSGRQYS